MLKNRNNAVFFAHGKARICINRNQELTCSEDLYILIDIKIKSTINKKYLKLLYFRH